MSGSTTTYTTARFLSPDYLTQGADNVISCPLWASGALVAPTSGTVSVYDAGNNLVVNAAAVTVAASIATYTIPASVLPSTLARGMGWRIEWSLVVSTITTVYRNSAGLVKSQLAPVVTDADLFRRVSGLNPAGTAPLSSLTNYQAYLDEAWISLLGKLTGKGNLPHLIMEPTALREPHLFLTLSLIFSDFRTRLDNDKWAEQAKEYDEKYSKAWDGLAFEYDTSDSGQSDGRRKRGANPSIWMGGFD